MPDERLPEDEAVYYPPRRSPAQIEWEIAVQTAIEWCDTYDQQSDAHTFDAAELAGSARAVIQRLIDEIRLRGL
jgi:hypothetical protein